MVGDICWTGIIQLLSLVLTSDYRVLLSGFANVEIFLFNKNEFRLQICHNIEDTASLKYDAQCLTRDIVTPCT